MPVNEPIDILEIAASRYAKALEWWNATEMMNYSTGAIIAGARAQAELDIARDDLFRARKLCTDLDLVTALT